MKKSVSVVAAVVILGGIVAAYFYSQHQRQPEPVQAQAPPPAAPPAAPAPVVRQVIETVPAQPPLPVLSESDKFMLDTLADPVGNRSLMQFFHTERIIRNIVATIDNLPRNRAPLGVMPVKPAHGGFIAKDSGDDKTIGPENAARYAPYVRIAEAIDARKLVEVYVRLYPLFQQAYEELGYPEGYFNDRLLVALDDLLAAPDLKEPVKLVQPKVFYQFADPGLEARSAGQKILMRIGGKNGAIIKAKLREINRQVMLHMHDKKVEIGK